MLQLFAKKFNVIIIQPNFFSGESIIKSFFCVLSFFCLFVAKKLNFKKIAQAFAAWHDMKRFMTGSVLQSMFFWSKNWSCIFVVMEFVQNISIDFFLYFLTPDKSWWSSGHEARSEKKRKWKDLFSLDCQFYMIFHQC